MLPFSRSTEGRSVALFFSYAFLLLVCYYVLKPLREPLLLVGGSAALKSYACGVVALVLMLLVPLYGFAFRRIEKTQLVRRITGFFVVNLVLFYLLGNAGFDIGFAYYVWVGVFGVTMLAQFWAHAANSFDVRSGQRLFPFVMAGATLGGLAGPPVVAVLFPVLGPWNMLLVAAALLAATLPLVAASRESVPESARSPHAGETDHHPLGGFGLVLRSRYLLSLALLVVLLNCVNTMGEYVLTDLVVRHADAQVAANPDLDKGNLIAVFFGSYYFAVNALTVIVQVFLVARIFRWIGVGGALLVLPLIAFIGYTLIAFIPIFGLIRVVKIVENSVDYSLMNTARHALYLPLPAAHQYDGKTAVDGFFWRFGDVLQAALIYVGLNWLGFGQTQFAIVNMLLAAAWIGVAAHVAKRYARRARRAEPRRCTRRARVLACAAVLGAAPLAVSGEPAVDRTLFADRAPLELELVWDGAALCRKPSGCADAPATLVYHAPGGGERRVDVSLRVRGRWQPSTAGCRLPALFVFFDEATAAGTPFAGEKMLPLTTHCREGAAYEQYVLKEYLAYRIYGALTPDSLRTRLARIVYHDGSKPSAVAEHVGFFVEHFDSLAARRGTEVWRPPALDLAATQPRELGRLALFEYMIGNTDWSAVYGHNVVLLRDAREHVTAVPYDFDYSGLVDAAYAVPAEQLPIRDVTQRLFRGFCLPDDDWAALFEELARRRDAVAAALDDVPGLAAAERARALEYLTSFFEILESPKRRERSIVAECRKP